MHKLINENATKTLRVFLNSLKVSFSKQTIDEFKDHPGFPSMLSLSDVLTHLGIEHLAIRASYSQLCSEIPKPAIVHTLRGGGMFLVIADADKNKVHFINERNQIEQETKEEFLKVWSGVVLIVDNEINAREAGYFKNKVKEVLNEARLPLFFLGIVVWGLYLLAQLPHSLSWVYYCFFIAKSSGLIFSVLLFIYELDANNPYVTRLCSPGKKVDCSSVLNSPGAKPFGLFSWTEIGLVYFITTLLNLLFFPSLATAGWIALAAISASLYIPYSIYYQWKVVKRWCRLCLMIQVILFLELFLSIVYLQRQPDLFNYLSLSSLAPLLLLFLFVLAAFSLLAPLFSERKNLNTQVEKLLKIKFNPKVFNFLLDEIETISTKNLPATIQFGNSEGKHLLTLVSNPICDSCVEMHHNLFYLLRTKNNIKVEEIFLTNSSDQATSKRVAKTMIQLFKQSTPEKFQYLLKEFYEAPIAKAEAWIQKYSIQQEQDSLPWGSDLVQEHFEWCKSQDIFSTPRIYLNGKPLPKGYDLRDMEYLID